MYLFNKPIPKISLSNNVNLFPSLVLKILGITFGNHRHLNKLNFTPHINNLIDKIKKISNIFFAFIGNTWGINCIKRINLFKSMIRPAITYGCQIWFDRITVKSKSKLVSLQHNILIKATKSYRTVSKNIISVVCNICHLDDYCEILSSTYFIPDKLVKKLERINREKQYIENYFNETNSNFRSFFLSLPIPSFFRPTFFNMQFLSAHGNFNNYLHRMNIISSPFCECNRFIQDPQHILFNCDYYNFSNRHQFISPDQFLLNQHNFNLFNQICCCYFSKKITVN